jgi:hypothetical protein
MQLEVVSCINTSQYFWYSVLPDDDLFRPKHVVTKFYTYNKNS